MLQGGWIALTFILMLWRFKYGLAAYLSYIILVPYLSINIGTLSLQWNLVNSFVLIVFLWNYNKHKDEGINLDIKPLYPFLTYYGLTLIAMLFQGDTPFAYEFNNWRTQMMKFMIIPFVLWNYMHFDPKSIPIFRNTLIICSIIAIVYGLFLTQMPGINPYIMSLMEINNIEFNESYMIAENEGRLFGRISSVFTHPMTFGLFLGFTSIYIYQSRKYYNPLLITLILSAILINTIVCGVRSSLVSLFFTLALYLLLARDYKLLIIIIALATIGWFTVDKIPILSQYLESISDVNSVNVKGSSVRLRLDQLEGCFKEIKYCFLEGKGFDWHYFYLSTKGIHPRILAFESLIFVILCDNGILGFLFWGIMCAMIVLYNYRETDSQEQVSLNNALLEFYIIYATVTGEYGYMQYFLIFYILLHGNIIYDRYLEYYSEDEEQLEYPQNEDFEESEDSSYNEEYNETQVTKD